MRAVLLTGLALLAVTIKSSPAATINMGIISFDVLVPDQGAQLGVNVLNLQNLTGNLALAPDFPIITAIVLDQLTLTILSAGGSQVVSLGSFGPGPFPSEPALQFASNVEIGSVILAGILDLTKFSLDGGESAAAHSDSVTYVLLPSAGTALQAGTDLGVISLETISDVPEPASAVLLLVGACGLLALSGKRQA